MISKSQKFRKHSLDEKEETLNKYLDGYSTRYLGEMYGISRT